MNVLQGGVESVADLALGGLGALLRASIIGGTALFVALLICRGAPGLSPRARCWVLRLAHLKLFLILIVAGAVDLPVLRPAPAPRAVLHPASPGLAASALLESDVASSWPPPAGLGTGPLVLCGLWLVGVALGTRRLVRAARRARALVEGADPVDIPRILALAADVSARVGLRRPPPLARSHLISGPMVVGVFRPVILLPKTLPTPQELEPLLAHELGHVRRRDLAWGWLPALAQVIFFFHPVMWLIRADWELAQESACDSMALVATRASPRAYGEMLLNVAVRRPAQEFSRAVVVSAVSTATILRSRLLALSTLTRHPPQRSRAWVQTAGALVAMAVLIPWRLVEWSPIRGLELSGALHHRQGVRSVSFAPGGRVLASTGGSGSVRLWDTTTGRLIEDLSAGPTPISSAAFSPDGRTLARATARSLKFHRLSSSQGAMPSIPIGPEATSMAYSPDGLTLALAYRSGGVELREASTGRLRQTVSAACSSPLAWAPDGTVLAHASARGALVLTHGRSGRVLREKSWPQGAQARQLAWGPDGTVLAAVVVDSPRSSAAVVLLDLRTGVVTQALPGDGARAIAFSPDGRFLAATQGDHVTLLDPRSGRALASHSCDDEPVTDLCLSPDGSSIATAGTRGRVSVWRFLPPFGGELTCVPQRS